MHCLFYVLSLKEVSKAILSNMVNKANSSVQIWEPYQISFQVRLPYVKSEINQPVQAYNASTCTSAQAYKANTCTICLGLQCQLHVQSVQAYNASTCTICLGLQCQYMYNLFRPTMPIHVQSVQAYNANTCTICLGPTMPIHVQSVQAYNASTCTTCSNQVSVAQSVSTFDC